MLSVNECNGNSISEEESSLLLNYWYFSEITTRVLFCFIYSCRRLVFRLLILFILQIVFLPLKAYYSLKSLCHLNILINAINFHPNFRKSAGNARKAIVEQSACDLQHTRAAGGQRVRSTCGEIRTDSPANHRCGKCGFVQSLFCRCRFVWSSGDSIALSTRWRRLMMMVPYECGVPVSRDLFDKSVAWPRRLNALDLVG